jgi:hypothetical protein
VTEEQRSYGRRLTDFQPLKPAEQKLLEACTRGGLCIISRKRPEAADQTDTNSIRAGFIRFLILGGESSSQPHEHGVSLHGGWIQGCLDLRGATSPANIYLGCCWFDAMPTVQDCRIKGVFNLSGSRLPGLSGDRLVCEAGLLLRDPFLSDGTIRLLGAEIIGDLDCSGASLKARLDRNGILEDALVADHATITGNVYLNKQLSVHGTIHLVGAKIGGDFGFERVTFHDNEQCRLQLDRMTVTGSFFFRYMSSPIANVLLNGATVGGLVDDAASWGEGLDLHGFIYDGIHWQSPTDAKARLTWLDKQMPDLSGKDGDGRRFSPQPWLQLKKVLREAGHLEEARQIGIALEERRRHCGKVGEHPPSWRLRGWLHRHVVRTLHWGFGLFTGYGYRPMKLVYWTIFVWLACGAYDNVAAYHGAFAPTDFGLLEKQTHTVSNWYLSKDLPAAYPGFHPLVYSLNVLLPVVDLQQEQNWHPVMPPPSPVWIRNIAALFTSWGGRAQILFWTETLFGWVAGLLLIAVLSGLTRKQDDGS